MLLENKDKLISNEFLSKFLWLYIAESFLASLAFARLSENPLLEAISLHGPTSSF
jgi:hypothetical protein